MAKLLEVVMKAEENPKGFELGSDSEHWEINLQEMLDSFKEDLGSFARPIQKSLSFIHSLKNINGH